MKASSLKRCALFFVCLAVVANEAAAATVVSEPPDLPNAIATARNVPLDPRDSAALVRAAINRPGDQDWISIRPIRTGRLCFQVAGPINIDVYNSKWQLIAIISGGGYVPAL